MPDRPRRVYIFFLNSTVFYFPQCNGVQFIQPLFLIATENVRGERTRFCDNVNASWRWVQNRDWWVDNLENNPSSKFYNIFDKRIRVNHGNWLLRVCRYNRKLWRVKKEEDEKRERKSQDSSHLGISLIQRSTTITWHLFTPLNNAVIIIFHAWLNLQRHILLWVSLYT